MARAGLIHDRLTYSVIGAFFEVYHTLGFGFLEQVYVASLARELGSRGHRVGREVAIPILYKGTEVARHRLDMIVDGKLVVETNSTRTLPRVPPVPCGPRKRSVVVASGDDPEA